MQRLSHLAPEEIAAAVLLVFALGIALLRPSAIEEVLRSPYATPHPDGGPARELVPDERPEASPGALERRDGLPNTISIDQERAATLPRVIVLELDGRGRITDRTGRILTSRLRSGPLWPSGRYVPDPCLELLLDPPGPNVPIALMCAPTSPSR